MHNELELVVNYSAAERLWFFLCVWAEDVAFFVANVRVWRAFVSSSNEAFIENVSN